MSGTMISLVPRPHPQKEGKGLAHFEPFLVFADSADQVILECRSRAQSRIPIKKSR